MDWLRIDFNTVHKILGGLCPTYFTLTSLVCIMFTKTCCLQQARSNNVLEHFLSSALPGGFRFRYFIVRSCCCQSFSCWHCSSVCHTVYLFKKKGFCHKPSLLIFGVLHLWFLKKRQESAAIYLLFIAYHILTMDIIYFKIKLAMNNRRLAEENSVIICAPSTSAQDDRGKE